MFGKICTVAGNSSTLCWWQQGPGRNHISGVQNILSKFFFSCWKDSTSSNVFRKFYLKLKKLLSFRELWIFFTIPSKVFFFLFSQDKWDMGILWTFLTHIGPINFNLPTYIGTFFKSQFWIYMFFDISILFCITCAFSFIPKNESIARIQFLISPNKTCDHNVAIKSTEWFSNDTCYAYFQNGPLGSYVSHRYVLKAQKLNVKMFIGKTCVDGYSSMLFFVCLFLKT